LSCCARVWSELHYFTLEEKQRALEALSITVIWRPGEPPEIHGSLPVEIVSNASRGGVGIGYSIHAGQVIVADGTPEAARRLERVLTTDPGLGGARHADAGYPEAIACARAHGLKIPMLAATKDGP